MLPRHRIYCCRFILRVCITTFQSLLHNNWLQFKFSHKQSHYSRPGLDCEFGGNMYWPSLTASVALDLTFVLLLSSRAPLLRLFITTFRALKRIHWHLVHSYHRLCVDVYFYYGVQTCPSETLSCLASPSSLPSFLWLFPKPFHPSLHTWFQLVNWMSWQKVDT